MSVLTFNELTRMCCQDVLNKWYTKLMTIPLIESTILWLDALPENDDISDQVSPATVI